MLLSWRCRPGSHRGADACPEPPNAKKLEQPSSAHANKVFPPHLHAHKPMVPTKRSGPYFMETVRMGLQFRDDPRGDQFFALRTFRRDGSATSTPIWLAPAGAVGTRTRRAARGRSGVSAEARASRSRHPTSTVSHTPSGGLAGHAYCWHQKLRTAKRPLTAKYGKFRLLTIALLIGRPRKRGGRAVGLEISLDSNSTSTERPS